MEEAALSDEEGIEALRLAVGKQAGVKTAQPLHENLAEAAAAGVRTLTNLF